VLVRLIHRMSAVLTSIGLLSIGYGLLTSTISLRLAREGYPDGVIGVVNGAFFAGGALGALLADRVIIQVGHSRAFAGFAAVFGCAILGHLLILSIPVWIALRAISGFVLYGLLMVAESSLAGCCSCSASAPRSRRPSAALPCSGWGRPAFSCCTAPSRWCYRWPACRSGRCRGRRVACSCRRRRSLPAAASFTSLLMPLPESLTLTRTYWPGFMPACLAANAASMSALALAMVSLPPSGMASRPLMARSSTALSS
jgi:hypothetical protein